MTNDEARELSRRWRAGDSKAREALVLAYRGLAIKWARAYPETRARFDDAVQEGMVALLTAVDRYDPEHPNQASFATYAGIWVKTMVRTFAIKCHEQRTQEVLKRSRPIGQAWYGIGKARRELVNAGISPTPAALAEKLGVAVEHVEQAIAMTRRPASLDATTPGDATPMVERIASDVSTPEEAAAESEEELKQRQALWRAMGTLNARQRQVLRRLYLSSDDDLTLAEVGREMGLSRERVRQLRETAIALAKTSIQAEAAWSAAVAQAGYLASGNQGEVA